MHYRLFSSLVYLACLAALLIPSKTLIAQDDQAMAEVFNWRFETTAPDATFIPMDGVDGWEEPSTQAKLVCMAMPTPFDLLVKDLKTLHTEDGQTVVDTSTLEIGGVTGFLMLLEFASIAGTDSEVSYSLMFARPYRGVSLLLTAQYPKSKHSQLHPKFLESFATVRQINE